MIVSNFVSLISTSSDSISKSLAASNAAASLENVFPAKRERFPFSERMFLRELGRMLTISGNFNSFKEYT